MLENDFNKKGGGYLVMAMSTDTMYGIFCGNGQFFVEPGFFCRTMQFAVKLVFFVPNKCYNVY